MDPQVVSACCQSLVLLFRIINEQPGQKERCIEYYKGLTQVFINCLQANPEKNFSCLKELAQLLAEIRVEPAILRDFNRNVLAGIL